MPKKYGVKEKDLVVTYVVNLILTGKLRSGDRLDRNEIADDLGISRVPIQEAVVQLEHDGIVSTHARTACAAAADLMGQIMLAELVRRGVLEGPVSRDPFAFEMS
jgi:DNA-binding GntR family transcriptional regulator